MTCESCGHVEGPCYHGTRSDLEVGDELVPGHGSDLQEGRVSNHVYFPGGQVLIGTHAGDGDVVRTVAYGGVPAAWTTHLWRPEQLWPPCSPRRAWSWSPS
ncbi:NAD(+)--rifampin ADP-ribosyltransferase [Geodermatophilus sp. SYSU D00815]